MTIESAYLKWNRGNRVNLYGGVKLAEGFELKYSMDCQALYLPLLEGWNPSKEEVVGTAKRGMRLRLLPAGTINPVKHKVKVVFNPALIDVADVQCPDIIESDEGGTQPVVTAKFYKDFELSTLDWVVKLYLLA